jgi:hypothetical protein
LGAGVVAGGVYLATMARTVGFIDRGELAAVATTLGIAHPTGYPLLTLLGHVATRVWPASPLILLNGLAALWVAAGIGVLVCLYDDLLRDVLDRASSLAAGARIGCAALAALLNGFSVTWWQQANGFEAYSLHALLLPLVCWTFVRYLRPAAARDRFRGPLFAFVLGLSFANHLTTMVLAPTFLLAFGSRWRRQVPKQLLSMAPFFVLGLTPYLYLPLRAASAPRFTWGDPDTPSRFLMHVSGRQYHDYLLADVHTVPRQLSFILGVLPRDWVVVGLVLAGIGFVTLCRRRAYAVAILSVGVASMAWASIYAIRDVDPYLMAASLTVGALVAFGLATLAMRFGSISALACGALSVCLAIALHGRQCDERTNTMVEDYVANILEELPQGAVLASSQWDHLVSPSFYLQEVAGLRRDVVIVDPVSMHWAWYVRELDRRAPGLLRHVRTETHAFLDQLEPMERGQPFDRERAGAAYHAMMAGLERSIRAEGRRLFVTWEVQVPAWRSLEPVPLGLTAELRADTAYVPFEMPRYRFRPWRGRHDHYVATMARNYGEPIALRAVYEARHDRPGFARQLARSAARYAPAFGMTDLPPLPLDARELVQASLELFQRLERVDAVPPAAADRR